MNSDVNKEIWGNLTDDEIETLKGTLGRLSSKIRIAYGFAIEKEEIEYNEFKESIALKKRNRN